MGEQIPHSYLELEGLVQRKKQELLVRFTLCFFFSLNYRQQLIVTVVLAL